MSAETKQFCQNNNLLITSAFFFTLLSRYHLRRNNDFQWPDSEVLGKWDGLRARQTAALLAIYLFIMKFVQLDTQIKTQCKKENIQKYTKSTL